MRFTINLATRTYLDQRLVKRAAALILTVLVVMLVWNIYRTAGSFGELRRLRADNITYENKLNSRPSGVSEKEYTQLLTKISFYNEVIGRKTFSWIGILDQLEGVTTEGIAFSALAPDRKSGLLKIDGRARSFAQLRAFLNKLEDSRIFTAVMLLSHSDIAVGEKARGVQFSISCKAALQ
jgi:type IV pilus assembly protein PilN